MAFCFVVLVVTAVFYVDTVSGDGGEGGGGGGDGEEGYCKETKVQKKVRSHLSFGEFEDNDCMEKVRMFLG